MYKRLKATLWMVIGSFLIFSSVVVMNKYMDTPEPEKVEKKTNFDVKQEKKKEIKDKPKPKPKPKKVSQAPRAPLPTVGSAIGGVDLGLPEFDIGMGNVGDSLLGDMSNVVMTDDSVDIPPRPAQRAPLQYPAKARSKGITGYVVMNLLINPTGDVEHVKLLESHPAGVFDEVAIASVREWHFQPAMYKGNPVKAWAKQRISFDLN